VISDRARLLTNRPESLEKLWDSATRWHLLDAHVRLATRLEHQHD